MGIPKEEYVISLKTLIVPAEIKPKNIIQNKTIYMYTLK